MRNIERGVEGLGKWGNLGGKGGPIAVSRRMRYYCGEHEEITVVEATGLLLWFFNLSCKFFKAFLFKHS